MKAFSLISEEAISKGIRRIVAITGPDAERVWCSASFIHSWPPLPTYYMSYYIFKICFWFLLTSGNSSWSVVKWTRWKSKEKNHGGGCSRKIKPKGGYSGDYSIKWCNHIFIYFDLCNTHICFMLYFIWYEKKKVFKFYFVLPHKLFVD